MGTNPTKAAGNIYCQKRKAAAMYNDRFNSREGAAEVIGVASCTLADWELGNTKVVPPEKVLLMADAYNAPELMNYYCTHECPLGRFTPKVEIEELEKVTLKVIASFKNIDGIKDSLIDIAADGQITPEERPQLNDILQFLDDIVQKGQALKLWAEKNLKQRVMPGRG